jgi:hypothetical protein
MRIPRDDDRTKRASNGDSLIEAGGKALVELLAVR